MSAFETVITNQVVAADAFTKKALECNDPDHAKDWTLASKNCLQAALAGVQAKMTREAGHKPLGRRS